jgi:hypothetical protein
MNQHTIKRISRNFQRGCKINSEEAIIPNLKLEFPNFMKEDYWKNRDRIVFSSKPKKEDFFKSSTWLDYMKAKKDNKQSKNDAVLAERLIHNKVQDSSGLNCKQRRNKRRRDEKAKSNSNMV